MNKQEEAAESEKFANNFTNEMDHTQNGNIDTEQQLEKLPYPKSVFFIVSNEFCERFSYYGMRTILSIYLVDILLFSQSDATVIYHTFTMLVYFFPIFGAILSDSLLGKFRTILYVSCIYASGNIILALAATPPLNFPAREISVLGLLLIALGTGGIKPCVSAFGGDQFVLPQQEKQLAMFFSLFYFSINAGSLISTFITPILRQDVKCFDQDSCYSLAFAVPGVLMIVSIIIFALGKPMYRIKTPEGNMLVRVSKCISGAISNKIKSKGVKKEHWLDYAEEEHGAKLVRDVKALLKVLVLYIPLPVFWALFDQQGSGWTFMARRMNGSLGFMTILPDQMQVVNPLLILAFIPLFQYAIYPLLNKCRFLTTPLQRLVAGGGLASLSFVVSAVICIALEGTYPTLPTSGNGQIRIYNSLPCDLQVNAPQLSKEPLKINSLASYENIDIPVNNIVNFEYEANGDCIVSFKGNFMVFEKKSMAYFFNSTKTAAFAIEDNVDKNVRGNPNIRIIINRLHEDKMYPIKFINPGGDVKLETNTSFEDILDLPPDDYKIEINKKFSFEASFLLGGVYTVLATEKTDTKYETKVIEVTEPNSIHILLLIPQYIIITMGEIMFSITGLEFAYSQAPSSMKSVLQACWLLTTAFGNLIVVIVESIEPFHDQSNTFFLYAGLMLLDMAVFSLMAVRYKYVEKEETSEDLNMPPVKQNGIDNAAFNKTFDEM
ncbi:hypothetical protein ILUMI_23849 [Ignelater luminosus]|uniref:Oligopeptide transporter 1 n=1 Tax=Ignelater luminosus TaxID=2038154 RepID=A0A8K0CEL3_IGNLU|nr:hypothetical protein ILUMI_23849 [Ignelater luminosus]